MSEPPIGERIARVEVRLDRQEKDMMEIRDDVKHIRTFIDQDRGGWKTLVVVGTIASAFGAGFIAVVGWVTRGGWGG